MILSFENQFGSQTRMRSNPMGLDVWSLVVPFVYFQILQRDFWRREVCSEWPLQPFSPKIFCMC